MYQQAHTQLDANAMQVRSALNANNLNVNGTGVKVGIISGSFNSGYQGSDKNGNPLALNNGQPLPDSDLGYGTVLPHQSMVHVLKDDLGTTSEEAGR